jgi:CRISPR/Cas system endoribonuclease Cas6 (RAMP superfamily)
MSIFYFQRLLRYAFAGRPLKKPNPYPTSQAIDDRCEALCSVKQITIGFQTPTRIKFEGSLTGEPEFHNLIRSLLRRLSALSYFHCGRKLDIDFKGLIERAHQIRRTSSDLRWHDWDRYSSRQKQKMTLGGFLGKATFEGDFREFLPFLTWGEILHIGKAASFGLGRYSITPTF